MTTGPSDTDIHREPAITVAWPWWVGLLLVLAVLAWSLLAPVGGGAGPVSVTGGRVLFGLAIAWLVMAVPGAMVLRGHCLRAPWDARGVEPGSYMKGMKTIWLSIMGVWILAWAGCLIGGDLQPGMILMLIGLLVYLPLMPDRRAVKPRHEGHS